MKITIISEYTSRDYLVHGLKPLQVDDLLSAKEINSLELEAYYMSLNLLSVIQEEFFLQYDGVNLMPIGQLELFTFLKNVLLAKGILDQLSQRHTDKDVYFYCTDENLLPLIFHLNKKCYPFDIELKSKRKRKRLTKTSVISVFKKFYFDNILKLMYGNNKKKFKTDIDILIYGHVYNRPTSETLYIIFQELKNKNEKVELISSEERILSHFFSGEGILSGSKFRWIDFLKYLPDIYKFSRINRAILKKNKNKLSEQFNQWIGFDALIYPFLCKLVTFLYPLSIYDHHVFKRVIHEHKPKVIVLGTDCHRLSRHLCLICSGSEIHTLVMQHGATNGIYGFAPLYSTEIAVWGDISKQKLMSWGIEEKRMVKVGNPRYDVFINNGDSELKTSNYILALSGWSYDITLNVLHLVLEAWLKIEARFILSIRPHPSERDLSIYYSIIECYDLSNVRIDLSSDVRSAILNCDGVITCQSTIGIESLLLNKGLIELKLKTVHEEIPYDRYNCVFFVEQSCEVISAIREIDNNNQEFLDRQINAMKFLLEYLGDIEGRSREKIVGLIQERIRTHMYGGDIP